MGGSVIKSLEKSLHREFMDTRRCQLDWERSSLVEYDDYSNRSFCSEKPGESDHFNTPRNIRQIARDWQEYEPLFKFFMDGSRRTFRIADVPFDTQCFPVVAGQVGVGICSRENRRLSVFGDFRIKFVLALPLSLDVDGRKAEANHKAFFKDLCGKVNRGLENNCPFKGFYLDRILYYETKRDDNYEDKAVSVIQEYMIEQEKQAVKDLVLQNQLDNETWLLKDGSLEYARLADRKDPFAFSAIQSNYKSVIGVSKSFNPELARQKNNKSASRCIAELKEGERTPAFRYETSRADGKFAIWYLRLRKPRGNAGPFDGVVKIEKLLLSDTELEKGLDTLLVDRISAWVYNERNPVCYGKDSRWTNHLYPIYLTEQFVKSKYWSTNLFVNIF